MPMNFVATQSLPAGPEPAHVGTKEVLIQRALARLRSIPGPLERYTFLASLRNRNADVFYGLVGGNMKECCVRSNFFSFENLIFGPIRLDPSRGSVPKGGSEKVALLEVGASQGMKWRDCGDFEASAVAGGLGGRIFASRKAEEAGGPGGSAGSWLSRAIAALPHANIALQRGRALELTSSLVRTTRSPLFSASGRSPSLPSCYSQRSNV